jgi:hypothetical protein
MSKSARGLEPVIDVLLYHAEHIRSARVGVGRDAYTPGSRPHAMANAMYARGFLHLHELTGSEDLLQAATGTLDGLMRLRSPHGRACWGLGFRHRDLAADEPYAITTAICGSAFVDHHARSGDRGSLRVAHDAARWLAQELPWSVTTAGAAPWYSPNLSLVLPNVASMTGGFLARVAAATGDTRLARQARLAVSFVLHRQQPPGYWGYGQAKDTSDEGLRADSVVDAIHSAYVLDGLVATHASLVGTGGRQLARAVQEGGAFYNRWLVDGGRCSEKVVVMDADDAAAVALRRNPRLREAPLPPHARLFVFPGESRLWGYGAALGAFARGEAAGLLSTHRSLKIVDRLLRVQLSGPSGRFHYLPGDARAYVRHESHLFEGLAAFVLQTVGTPMRPRPVPV